METEHGQTPAISTTFPPKNVLGGLEKLLVHESHVYRGKVYLPGEKLEQSICGRRAATFLWRDHLHQAFQWPHTIVYMDTIRYEHSNVRLY
jgi:hypothetical protein